MGTTATAKAPHAEAAVMLTEAHAHITKVGWAKGNFRAPSGAVCLLQGLRDVDGAKHGKPVEQEVFRIVTRHAHGAMNLTGDSLVSWNDAPERTKAHVLDLLLACAVIERELAEGATT